eukprot:g3860.t1
MSTIDVAVRVRPSPGTDPSTIPSWIDNNCKFASCVVTGSDQTKCFEKVASRLLYKMQKGYSCCILAYGQTGSGKTFTMLGPQGSLTETALAKATGVDAIPIAWGIFPRIALSLLRTSGSKIRVSAVEVYNNVAYDLLNGAVPLSVSRAKQRNTVFVVGGKCEMGTRDAASSGGGDFCHPASCQCRLCFAAKSKLKEQMKRGNKFPRIKQRTTTTKTTNQFATIGEKLIQIETPQDVAKLAMKLEATRRSAGHNLNDHSSRSHCLVTLILTTKGKDNRAIRRNRFLFVDLAGSERTMKTGVNGERMKEAKQINSSLTVLGRVIRAIGKKKSFVPYRDSTLTMLLRSSFDDKAAVGSYASVIINVAPDTEHADESVCSLRFGERMSQVVNRANTVEYVDANAETVQLKAMIVKLKKKLAEMKRNGFGGGIQPNAIPSEVKSLFENEKRWAEAKQKLSRLQRKIAEYSTTKHGKYDRNYESKESNAENSKYMAQLSDATAEERTIREILQRQKTIKKLWRDPKPFYLEAAAKLQELENRLHEMRI